MILVIKAMRVDGINQGKILETKRRNERTVGYTSEQDACLEENPLLESKTPE